MLNNNNNFIRDTKFIMNYIAILLIFNQKKKI